MTKTKTSETTEAAPPHLEPETKAWWGWVVSTYRLEQHHLKLLVLACESFDRSVAAREAIGEQGLTYTNRHGEPRPRPEVSIEKDNRLSFARLLRELDLDCEPPSGEKPIPSLARYRRGNSAA